MCTVTHRAKPYQLAILIITSLDDIIGTHQRHSAECLQSHCIMGQYQYQNINYSLIYALFGESSIDTFKEICILHNI